MSHYIDALAAHPAATFTVPGPEDTTTLTGTELAELLDAAYREGRIAGVHAAGLALASAASAGVAGEEGAGVGVGGA